MWLFETGRGLRLALGLLICAVLAACNLTPVHAPNGAASKLENRISIAEPTTEDLYLLTRHVETKLGRSDPAPMKLVMTVFHGGTGVGTTATGFPTRIQRTGTLTYTLSNSDNGETIKTGTINRFTGYSTTGNLATSLAAERDSIKRLMVILADAMIDQLYLIDAAKLP